MCKINPTFYKLLLGTHNYYIQLPYANYRRSISMHNSRYTIKIITHASRKLAMLVWK